MFGEIPEGNVQMGCPSVEAQTQLVVPSVLLLVDRSGSMTGPFEMGMNRWDTVRSILNTPATGFVAKYQDRVRFGLMLYTSANGNQNPPCPMLTEVPVGLNNFDQIHATYGSAEPPGGGDTPTPESIGAAAASLLAFQEEGPKSIILATDGEPDTCAIPDPRGGIDTPMGMQDQEDFRTLSVEAVTAAYNQGITTHVISVGEDISEQHLKDLAVAGSGGDPNATFYQGSSIAMLGAAFEAIIGGVISCDYDLTNGEVATARAAEGTVTVNGMVVPYDAQNGWTLLSPTKIQFVGAACDQVKTGATIQVEFPCGVLK